MFAAASCFLLGCPSQSSRRRMTANALRCRANDGKYITQDGIDCNKASKLARQAKLWELMGFSEGFSKKPVEFFLRNNTQGPLASRILESKIIRYRTFIEKRLRFLLMNWIYWRFCWNAESWATVTSKSSAIKSNENAFNVIWEVSWFPLILKNLIDENSERTAQKLVTSLSTTFQTKYSMANWTINQMCWCEFFILIYTNVRRAPRL